MGPGRTHRRARMAPGRRGSGAGGWDLSRACEKPPGSGPRVGRMTRPRRGGSPGRSHPGSWATLRPGSPHPHPTHSSCRRGAPALRGAEAAGLRARESPPLAQRRRLGAGLRAPHPPKLGLAPSSLSSDSVDEPQDGGREGSFLAKVEVGVEGDTGASWGPLGPAEGSRTLVFSFPPAFLPSYLPALLVHST